MMLSMVGPWIRCPRCGAIHQIKRLGEVGVPRSMYGRRKRTRDPQRFKCGECKVIFRSRGVTVAEALGKGAKDDKLPLL